jgi:hypothetical protein
VIGQRAHEFVPATNYWSLGLPSVRMIVKASILSTVYSLCIHCVFTVYSLCIHCLLTICWLFIHWLLTVYSLLMCCLLAICSLCTHCTILTGVVAVVDETGNLAAVVPVVANKNLDETGASTHCTQCTHCTQRTFCTRCTHCIDSLCWL